MELPVSLLLLSLASACNAVMDICSHKFSISIFKNLTPQWWDAAISWKNKYINATPDLGLRKLFWRINYPVQLTDAWHLFKTIMIVLICLAIVFYKQMFNWWVDILILGTVWNCTFSLFYNKFLIK